MSHPTVQCADNTSRLSLEIRAAIKAVGAGIVDLKISNIIVQDNTTLILDQLHRMIRPLTRVLLAQNQLPMFRWEMTQQQLMEMLTQLIQMKQCMLIGLQKLKEYCQGRSLFSLRYNFCIPTTGKTYYYFLSVAA